VFHYWQFAEMSDADAAKIGEEVGLPTRVAGWVAKAKEFVAE
jgi:small subunit ribosomal protein S2